MQESACRWDVNDTCCRTGLKNIHLMFDGVELTEMLYSVVGLVVPRGEEQISGLRTV